MRHSASSAFNCERSRAALIGRCGVPRVTGDASSQVPVSTDAPRSALTGAPATTTTTDRGPLIRGSGSHLDAFAFAFTWRRGGGHVALGLAHTRLVLGPLATNSSGSAPLSRHGARTVHTLPWPRRARFSLPVSTRRSVPLRPQVKPARRTGPLSPGCRKPCLRDP
ncbi:hypothetical protein Z043_107988 [Scleropages formosus]|uniref:Uncharacterized protein n=1 Tax=Scleropages formosus TaxID=113540 RepID=A0A0N8K0S6_SCLFO|nr:hypothetical protein Z043_107988 [Scleropages formosus]